MAAGEKRGCHKSYAEARREVVPGARAERSTHVVAQHISGACPPRPPHRQRAAIRCYGGAVRGRMAARATLRQERDHGGGDRHRPRRTEVIPARELTPASTHSACLPPIGLVIASEARAIVTLQNLAWVVSALAPFLAMRRAAPAFHQERF